MIYLLQKGAEWYKLKDVEAGEMQIRLKKCKPGEQVSYKQTKQIMSK